MAKTKITRDKARIKKTAEIFTPSWMVEYMLDQLEAEAADGENPFSPEKTYMEPSCGDGNFTCAILLRKLADCMDRDEAITSLGSICGIDIMVDNIAACRENMAEVFAAHFEPGPDVEEILQRTIVNGDFATGLTPDGHRIWFLEEAGDGYWKCAEARRKEIKKRIEKQRKKGKECKPLSFYLTAEELAAQAEAAV